MRLHGFLSTFKFSIFVFSRFLYCKLFKYFGFFRIPVRVSEFASSSCLKARVFLTNPSSYFYPAMNFLVAASKARRFSIVDLAPRLYHETADPSSRSRATPDVALCLPHQLLSSFSSSQGRRRLGVGALRLGAGTPGITMATDPLRRGLCRGMGERITRENT